MLRYVVEPLLHLLRRVRLAQPWADDRAACRGPSPSVGMFLLKSRTSRIVGTVMSADGHCGNERGRDEHDAGRGPPMPAGAPFQQLDERVQCQCEQRGDRERRERARDGTHEPDADHERGHRNRQRRSRTAGRCRVRRLAAPVWLSASEYPMLPVVTSLSYERMADVPRTPAANAFRVRLSLRTALALVFAFGVTVLVLEIARDAERVIAWVLSAMAIAALAVSRGRVARALPVRAPSDRGHRSPCSPRSATLGFLGYRIVNDVSKAMSCLQSAAPARAGELEKNSDFFREIKLQAARHELRRRNPATARRRRDDRGDRSRRPRRLWRSSPG